MAENLILVNGSPEDFREATAMIYRDEGWFISIGDYEAYSSACQPNGFKFIVAKDSDGKFVGCVTLLRLEEDLAFIDNFYTHPDFRGRGIGKRTFAAALTEDIRQQCNVGLHADLSVSEYYSRKQGFAQFQDASVQVFHATNFNKSLVTAGTFSTVDVHDKFEDILRLDEAVWRRSRRHFLSVWLGRPDVVARAISRDGEFVGYGVLRPSCHQGDYILGPVYLRREEALLPLLHSLVEGLEAEAVVEIRSLTSSNERLRRLLKDYCSLTEHTQFITQYTKHVPNYDSNFVYCITDTATSI